MPGKNRAITLKGNNSPINNPVWVMSGYSAGQRGWPTYGLCGWAFTNHMDFSAVLHVGRRIAAALVTRV